MLNVKTSKDMEIYFNNLLSEVKKLYNIAEECRKKGLDVSSSVEIPLASDMADRVEGLVGPKGISKRIRELVSKMGKEPAALEIAKEISEGKYGNDDREKLAEQAVRTALAILTEGIVAAPLEGIASVKIKKNRDGSEYLAIYFAGPIRSAGGTAQALAVLVGDYVRKNMGLNRYIPTEDEIERYVEEVDLYQSDVGSFQYSPKPEEIRTAVRNIPIEITGEPTDDVEVSGHRDLDRVETNQLRGGALLALVEGVLLKAPKIIRHVDKLGIEGWDWLKELKGKNNKKEDKKEEKEDEEEKTDYELDNENYGEDYKKYEDIEVEAITKFIGEVIAGRPVFAHPSKKGGFRLRYGRSRNTGFATDGFHPALMYLVDDFMAVGTQLKTERPGKATCVVPVDSIEPPIVKLKDGSVIKIDSVEKAVEYRNSVEEILFLGDILINYGDFLENNHPILPSSWCVEWYEKILISKNIQYTKDFINNPNHKEVVKFAIETDTPLHPKYTYYWHDVDKEDIKILRDWILSGKLNKVDNKDMWVVPYDTTDELHNTGKRTLELIGCCHKVLRDESGKYIAIEEYYPLLYSLGYDIENNSVKDIEKYMEKAKNSLHLINLLSPFEIKRNAYIYIGARMGRPEKAAPRKMKPPVNSLFPIGNAGGQVRLINKAVDENNTDDVEVSYGKCENCGKISLYKKCPFCGSNVQLSGPEKIKLPLKDYWYKALERLGMNKVGDVKCIKGMTSKLKVVEPLEKGILRAINDVYVFKDGTIRFDCTDVPITHFKPNEINVSISKLKELGYDKDIYGNPLTDGEQIVELKVQDVIIPESCADYFLKVSKFVDDLLEKYYGLDRFYNAKTKDDLIGHLVIGMAPHTSAGMVGRIVGYSKANVGYAHPYFHASKRRNCFPKDTKILVNIGGKMEKLTMEELYNLFGNEVVENNICIKNKPLKSIKTYSYDIEKNKVILSDIKEVLKLPSPNHLININLEDNRSFTTTNNHPVIVYKDGRFIEKIAMDVKEGDLIFIPNIDGFNDNNIDNDNNSNNNINNDNNSNNKESNSKESNNKNSSNINNFNNNFNKNNNKGNTDNNINNNIKNNIKNKNHNKNSLTKLNGQLIKVKKIDYVKSSGDWIYSLNVPKYHNIIINENILTHQCDGDEDALFLLLEAFINFSKMFLPDKRGGQMDAPLVLTTILDPKEVDGEVHNMDTMWEYPLEFYEKSILMPSPKEIKSIMETVEDRLEKPEQYEGLGYTHETTRIDNGPLICAYKTLGSMLEKTEAQLSVAKKIRATDERDVAEKVIQSHFVPDLIGNLRAFSRQGVRCKCGAKYRRVPLKGKCVKCGSNLILTVSKGAVEKYMDVSQKMAEKYNASEYIKQRLELIKEGIDNLFENDKNKQMKMDAFFK